MLRSPVLLTGAIHVLSDPPPSRGIPPNWATQIQHLYFFINKNAEFTDLNEETGLRLGFVDWKMPSGSDKSAGDRFMLHAEEFANGSGVPVLLGIAFEPAF